MATSRRSMPPTESRPSSIADAVAYVIGHLKVGDREAIAALDDSQVLPKLHHGLGTWIRNQLIHPTDAAASSLRAECTAVLATETAARVAADPVLATAAARFESLRPPPGSDDLSAVIIRCVWETLRGKEVS